MRDSAKSLSHLNVRRLSCAILNVTEGLAMLLCLSGGRTRHAHGFYFYFVANYLPYRNPRIFSHYLCEVVPAPTNITVQVPRPSPLVSVSPSAKKTADIQGTAIYFLHRLC
jgi:hypothetical protein